MAMINIPSTNDDPAYRYKMPKLVSKKEGRGNGSKTCIVNMGDVARALKRPPQYTTKYFGNELGAQTTYTNKEGEGERAIVNGHHETSVFQNLLDGFISKYVCCENCKLPEIDMAIKKGMISGRCMACGWSGNLDNNHKLAAFITKNPPDATGLNIVVPDEKGKGVDKKARREAKLKARQEANENENDEDDEEEDDEEDAKKEKKDKKDKKEKKDKKDKKDKKEKKEKKEKKQDKGSDDEDSDDSGKAKKEKKEKKEKKDKKDKKEKKEKKDKKEKKEKKEKAEKKDDSDDDASDAGSDQSEKDDKDLKLDDEEVPNIIKVLQDFIKQHDGAPTVDKFFEELRLQQISQCFDSKLRLYIALESLCGDALDAKSCTKHAKQVKKCVSHGSMPAKDILWAFDAYVSKNPKCLSTFPMVLKVVYDEEWVSEEGILSYYNDDEGEGEPGFKEAKKSAAPFLKWLATVESSDDDDDDDDSDSD